MGLGSTVKLDWPELSGGLVEGMAPTGLTDAQFTDLVNFYPFAGDLRKRGGIRRLTDSAAPADIVSACVYRPNVGTIYPIVGLTDGFARMNPDGTFTRLTVSDGRIYNDVARRWVMLQFKDAWFAARAGDGTFKVGGSSEVHDAGIPAPISAPTLTEGAAGALFAGDYYGVYTYYNTRTGDESNPSPVSAACTIGAAKKIDWSAILISAIAGVDMRRLYRTYLNVTGEYYLVAEIPNNIDTTFTGDEVLVGDMGERASWLNGLPPSGVARITAWDERMFATDGRDLFVSQQSKPQAFFEGDVLYLFRDDKQNIEEIREFGDRLLVLKTTSTYYLAGAAGDYRAVVLSDKHGCPGAPDTLASGEGIAIWFGGDNFYRTDGNEVKAIGNVEIRETVDAIPKDLYSHMCATIHPEHSLYVCSYPSSALSVGNDKLLFYNYKAGVWSKGEHTNPSAAPLFLSRDIWTDEHHYNLAVFPSSRTLYRWWDSTTFTDDGTNYTCAFKTGGKAIGHGLSCALNHFMVMCDSVPGTVTLNVYLGGETVASVTRPAVGASPLTLCTGDAWKTFALDTTRYGLADYLQIELTYTGSRDLVIQELAAQMTGYARFRRPV